MLPMMTRYTTIELFNSSLKEKTKMKGVLEILTSAPEFAAIPVPARPPPPPTHTHTAPAPAPTHAATPATALAPGPAPRPGFRTGPDPGESGPLRGEGVPAGCRGPACSGGLATAVCVCVCVCACVCVRADTDWAGCDGGACVSLLEV